MPSVLTLLLAAFMMSEGDEPPAPTFCADVEPFEAFTIADGDEEEFGEDMGCTESDGNEPLDVDAVLDAV